MGLYGGPSSGSLNNKDFSGCRGQIADKLHQPWVLNTLTVSLVTLPNTLGIAGIIVGEGGKAIAAEAGLGHLISGMTCG
jgi:hypothetical protein